MARWRRIPRLPCRLSRVFYTMAMRKVSLRALLCTLLSTRSFAFGQADLKPTSSTKSRHLPSTERGQNFKTQGNDNFKLRKYKEAIAFYTQGLGDLDSELKEETKRTLWCNRAACHLALGSSVLV